MRIHRTATKIVVTCGIVGLFVFGAGDTNDLPPVTLQGVIIANPASYIPEMYITTSTGGHIGVYAILDMTGDPLAPGLVPGHQVEIACNQSSLGQGFRYTDCYLTWPHIRLSPKELRHETSPTQSETTGR